MEEDHTFVNYRIAGISLEFSFVGCASGVPCSRLQSVDNIGQGIHTVDAHLTGALQYSVNVVSLQTSQVSLESYGVI